MKTQRIPVAVAAMPTAFVMVAASIGAVLAQQKPTFETRLDLVPVGVSVIGNDGRPILDIDEAEFALYQDGKPAKIAGFVRPPQAIVTKALVMNNGRMTKHLAKVRLAITELFNRIGPPDRAGVGTLRSPRSPLLADRALLFEGLEQVLEQRDSVREFLAWYGLHIAVDELSRPEASELPSPFVSWGLPIGRQWSSGRPPDVRAVIVLSSGMDYNSPGITNDQASLEKRYVAAVESGAVVFGIGFEGPGIDKRLRRLSVETGGRFIEPNARTDWRVEVDKILEDLHGRYVLGFIPAALDGNDHTIEVRVNRPGAQVRAPKSYRAPRGGLVSR